MNPHSNSDQLLTTPGSASAVPLLTLTPTLTRFFGLAFVPIIERLRAQQEACNPPLQVKVTGVDGQSTVVRVPSPALSYYAQNLVPLLAGK